MPRTTRIYAPGVAFHVIAVTQGREHCFTDDVKQLITDDIDAAADAGGHRVLARVVMPNHFHIILKHGSAPLAWMMQRIMQRATYRVKKNHDVEHMQKHEGHVFQARYWAEPIPTSKYLRRAIVYTHLNPCKAQICKDPADYRWSSHSRYLALAKGNRDDDVGFADGLMIFADESINRADVVNNYVRFVEFCQERRRLADDGDWLLPGSKWFGDVPTAQHGDEHWLAKYTHFEGSAPIPKRVIDARGLAMRLLHRIDPNLDLDTIRFGIRRRALRAPVHELICGMLSASCRPSAVARLLNVSPSLVSKVRTEMRFAVTREMCRPDRISGRCE